MIYVRTFTFDKQSMLYICFMLQAKRMKDSVGINEVKKQKIYQVNLEIFYRKRRARSLYANQPAIMRAKIRQFENQRDSLYHYILRPESKYQLYLLKKDNILSAN